MNIVFKSTLVILLSSIFLTAVAGGENPFEAKIASAQTSQNSFVRLRTKFYMERHKKNERAQKLLDFSKDCKNEEISAKSLVIVINYYMKQKKWDDLLALSQVFFDKYPNMIALRTKVKVYLFRIISNKKNDLSIRRKAFDILSKRIKNCGSYLGFTRQFIQTAYPDKEEQYKIFSDLAFDAGPSFYSANFLLGFLQRIAWGNKNHQDIINKCNKFIEFYGKDSAGSKEVFKIKLKHQSALNNKEAKEELRKIKQQEKSKLAEINKIISTIKEQVTNKNYVKAIDDVQKLRPYPLSLINKYWRQLEAEINKISAAEKLLFALALSKVLPACKNLDRLFSSVTRDPNIFAPKHANNYFTFMNNVFTKKQNADVIIAYQRGHFLPLFLVRKISNHALKLKLYGILSNYCLKADIKDMAAELLYKKSKLEFDINKKQTVIDLAKIIKIFPNSGIAHKAAWLQNLLSGKSTISQGPSLLSKTCFSPSLSLEQPVPFNLMPKSSEEYLKPVNGVFSISANNTKKNVFAGISVIDASNSSVVTTITDDNPATGWSPKKIPAILLLPLKKMASLETVNLEMSGKINFHIDLLGPDNKILYRLEREWPFESLLSPQYAPKETVKMKFQPVSNVAALRIVVTDAIDTKSGITEIKAYESKYPALYTGILKTFKIPANSRSANVAFEKKEPVLKVNYTPDMECVRGYPMMRWRNPWKNIRKAPIYLRTVGDNLGIEFSGKSAMLHLMRKGGITWNTDFTKVYSIKKESAKSYNDIAITQLKDGKHVLSLKSWSLPAKNDTFGDNNVVFKKLEVSGKATVLLLVRFRKNEHSAWTKWKNIVQNGKSTLTIPVSEFRKGQCQFAMFSDTKEIFGNASPVISNLKVNFSNKTASEKLVNHKIIPSRSFVNDNMEELLKQIKSRELVVVYSKTGTRKEYELARRIADKAGVYLAPDDIGLNNYNYPGPVLAIGTPLRNRYCRQLIAQYFVYQDEAFLNNTNGFTGSAINAAGKTDFFYITADTPSGVIKAANRVLSKMFEYTPKEQPFTLFNASTIERIFPWQLHVTRKLSTPQKLEMAGNDRRSMQLGITFNKTINDIKVTCSDLSNEKGTKLATPEVRFMQFYELYGWFGNLRVPDPLVNTPELPIPANTATGIWLTFKTSSETPAGVYKGTINISANGTSKNIPLEVAVLGFDLPSISRIDTASYSSIPYWYHHGSDESKKAFRNLCKNEVEHSLSMVTVEVVPECKVTKNKNGKYKFEFDFKNLAWQIKIADEVYQQAGAPLPGLFGRITLKPKTFLNSFPSKEREGIDIEYQYAVQLTSFLKRNGYFNRFYLKVGDEPKNMSQWTKYAKPFKKGGLKITTAHATHYKDMKLATGIMDAFCPNYQHNIFIPYLQERKKTGDKIWWYCCGTPTTRITGKAIDNLPFYWLTAKWNFDGAHSYAALEPKEHGMEGNDIPFRYDHGLSFRIMFLPDGSLVDTIRRELESEGIKDCLLIYVIKDAIKKLRNSGNTKEAEYYSSKLESILESVVPYKYGYAKTPGEWEKARKKLYALAQHIQNP